MPTDEQTMTTDQAVEAIRAASFEAPKAHSHTEWAERIEAVLAAHARNPRLGEPAGPLSERLAAYIQARETDLCMEYHGGAWPDHGHETCAGGHAEALELLQEVAARRTTSPTA